MRYENWQNLNPLTDTVKRGTKCVCLADWLGFREGDVVTVDSQFSSAPLCIDENGTRHVMLDYELALLPVDVTEQEQKSVRKIVQIAVRADEKEGNFVALCDDGTAWILYGITSHEWHQLPSIPQ